MSWTHRGHRLKERRVDSGKPSLEREVESSLLTLAPSGPWFYVLLALVQVAAVFLVTRILPLPFELTLATLFASEGIVCMVVAWILAGREGDIGFAARAQVGRAQIAGVPDLRTTLPEAQADFDAAARNSPLILILVVYGVALLVVAFVLAV